MTDSSDPYLYPGTDVLKNLRGIRDPNILSQFEAESTTHPFREGNGRTQREFIRELGLQAGFIIDWSRITLDKMMVASRESFRSGDSSGLAALIQTSIT